ncbi:MULTISPECIES: trimeric intracellular cation channel family protein [Pseudoalteromonas]|uniref:trimeric intracellular cation channel family protein n=1 Tax=Pseudoalteromonas TaxID=53246 RepID=UPI000FFF2E17|nr:MULTISPECIES: trimeric intracellular cation channel family protein [Pseudoalteromonas]NLR16750.1 trimeric intracellular cation channel family protein [Pseudoalteromonas peptidolytica]RXF03646.1 trimeric intracellular cation channel family protein [Pseudoalteromonas sp. PS5]USD28310.1 trimeric intracellular cation channel family protein [Pseudoalteromonas sp. SCSIO 43201]
MTELYHWFDLLGVMVFAISGTLIAHSKHMDGFGVIVLAAATGIGGGTIRDLILDQPVFWLHDTSYIYAILCAVLISIFWLNRHENIPRTLLQIADAIGLAFFAVMGVQKALSIGMPDMTAIIMGVLTGCFGGVIRDVLAREIPLLLKGELYAITCIFGGIVYTQTIKLGLATEYVMLLSMASTLFLRLAAMRYNLVLHVFKYPN